VYGILDLIGDLGGVTELILLVLGSIFLPISRHSFYLSVIKTLYMANTSESDLFADSKLVSKRSQLPDSFPKEEQDEYSKVIQKHKVIKMKLLDSIRLFFCQGCLGKLNCGFWKNRDLFVKLQKEGTDRIDKELDILRLIKNLRNMKILLRNSIMDDKAKFWVNHSDKKIIDLDGNSKTDQSNDNADQPLPILSLKSQASPSPKVDVTHLSDAINDDEECKAVISHDG